MSEKKKPYKVDKLITISYHCNICNEAVKTERQIVKVAADFKISEISTQLVLLKNIACKEHPTEKTTPSFTFYHYQKIANTCTLNNQ
jgi:hypothetical protein